MIEIKDLKFKYQGAENYALTDLNLVIPRGKYIAVLGHNGSGKSTLSKLISGLYKPTEGEIVIDNIVISKATLKRVRQKIGIIFQNPDNQFIGSTVEDDIAFGLENQSINRTKMKEIIHALAKRVGMYDYLSWEPHTLSGGQKQRVAIASILALNPEIIIFDEVTAMLDPKGKTEVLKIIKEIQADQNKTLISITHDMDEAVQADVCLVLSQGKLIAQGPPRQILNDPRIIDIAKIDSPFIYRLSTLIDNVVPTYDQEEFLEQLWK